MEYKRLTKKGKLVIEDISEVYEAYWKLQELEDKIEQGTLIELPCKVGDTVYWLFTTNIQQEIYECNVNEILYTKNGLDICLSRIGFC